MIFKLSVLGTGVLSLAVSASAQSPSLYFSCSIDDADTSLPVGMPTEMTERDDPFNPGSKTTDCGVDCNGGNLPSECLAEDQKPIPNNDLVVSDSGCSATYGDRFTYVAVEECINGGLANLDNLPNGAGSIYTKATIDLSQNLLTGDVPLAIRQNSKIDTLILTDNNLSPTVTSTWINSLHNNWVEFRVENQQTTTQFWSDATTSDAVETFLKTKLPNLKHFALSGPPADFEGDAAAQALCVDVTAILDAREAAGFTFNNLILDLGGATCNVPDPTSPPVVTPTGSGNSLSPSAAPSPAGTLPTNPPVTSGPTSAPSPAPGPPTTGAPVGRPTQPIPVAPSSSSTKTAVGAAVATACLAAVAL